LFVHLPNRNGFNCKNDTYSDASTCSGGSGTCLTLPIIFRDFDGQQVATRGHPDFFYYGDSVSGKKTVCVPDAALGPKETLATPWPANNSGSNCASSDATALLQDLVATTLGADGTPTLVPAKALGVSCHFTDYDYTGVIDGVAGVVSCQLSDGTTREALSTTVDVIHSKDTFYQWYHDDSTSTATNGTKVIGSIELAANGTTPSGAPLYQFVTSNGRTVYDDFHDIFLRDLAANGQPGPAAAAGAVTSLSSGFFPLEDNVTRDGRSTVCNLWPYWLADKDSNCLATGGNDYHSSHEAYNGTNMPAHTSWEWDSEGWWPGNAPPTTGTLPGGYASPVRTTSILWG